MPVFGKSFVILYGTISLSIYKRLTNKNMKNLFKNNLIRICFCSILTIALYMDSAVQESVSKPMYFPIQDSVIVAASSRYKNASLIRRMLVGTNYRKEWSTPVKMPVFRLPLSGLVVKELGGGQQTKSLKLEDKDGKDWVLRTVDKDVTLAMPENLRGTVAQNIVQDMISAAYPYAPLTVSHLAKAIGVTAPDPILYYVGSDAKLGEFQPVFTGKVCFLEEKEPTKSPKDDTESTEDVEEEILEENDRIILQREVLKARLLDMLIADWDRHADQWRWGEVDSTNAKYYYAIPRDRDQAFFMANGIIPKVGKFISMHHINWFKNKSVGLKQLNYKSWKFDRLFLNGLDASEWQNTTKEFQRNLSDAVIAAAVKKLPPEIYKISGKKIESKLISRRNSLLENVMKYYEYISVGVTINGSQEKERFHVMGDNEKIVVSMYRFEKKLQKEVKIYQRSFTPKETYAIYLMGYAEDDIFFVDESVRSKIKLYIYGDEGADTFQVKGDIRNYIYDLKKEKNNLESTNNSKVKLR